MPMSMAPFTFQAMSTPVMSRPSTASRVVEALTSPSSSRPPSARTMPELSRPMRAMNMPRPALMALFMLGGMQETIISRRGVTLMIRKATPDRHTTARACCQV